MSYLVCRTGLWALLEHVVEVSELRVAPDHGSVSVLLSKTRNWWCTKVHSHYHIKQREFISPGS